MFILKWTEVKIKTEPKYEDIVSSILYDIGVAGLAIEDPRDIIEKAKDPSWDYIEPDELLEKYDTDEIIIKAYFSDEENLELILDDIKNYIVTLPKAENGEPYGEIELDEVFEQDWANNWKQFYKVTRLGENIVIKPSWEDYEPEEKDIVIKLDPGMAFGTGTHETTSLCVEQIEKNADKDSTLLDVGCGSGILSIVAAKLGLKDIVGVDIDELAVKVSRENAEINGVSDLIDFRKGDLLNVVDEKYDFVVANILAEIIVILNKDIRKCLKDDGLFIASGIILDKIDKVKESLDESGLEVIDVITKGEWACILSRLRK